MARPRRSQSRYLAGGVFATAALALLWLLLSRGGAPLIAPQYERVTGGAQEISTAITPAGEDSFVASVRALFRGPDRAAPASPAAPGAVDPGFRFIVAVNPPSLPAEDQITIKAFEAIYASFLDTLRAIPSLELIELESADAAMTTEDADFVLDIRGEIEAFVDPVWSFTVAWRATRAGTGSVTESQAESRLRAIELLGTDAAAALRRYPFPPQETRLLELQALALDVSLPEDLRFEALDELQDIPRRFELVGLDRQRAVAVTAVEIIANSLAPEVRARTWRAILAAGIADPYLVGPLIDSLLYDTNANVRIEAVKLLAREFGDDQRVRAALEYALGNDTAPQVKSLARWEFLDEDGRREYVRNTLLNADLSAAERFELLVADINDLHSYMDRQSGSAALSAALLAQRSSGGSGTGSARERETFERMLPLLIGTLSDAANEQLRAAAAALLVEHIADPRVRAALEQAASDERSFRLRMQLESALRSELN